jgi:hypothetical protein
VIVPQIKRRANAVGEGGRGIEARLEEAVGLARAIDLEVASAGVVPISTVRPATLVGKGKVEEIAGLVRAEEAGLVFVDYALSPVQQRNLEKAWGCKVVDRTALILEIFGARAHTREGALQVELAHLNYQKSRLVRSWTHLERQRGGFGFLGGPGETQIEADRRMIADRIKRIERELEGVKRRSSTRRPCASATSSATDRVMPLRIPSVAGRVTIMPSFVTIHALLDDPSVTKPSRSTNHASFAPLSRAACRASTFGSSAVVLMSTRSQRLSGTVMTETPASATASSLSRSMDLAVTTKLGRVPAGGKAWSRRATPRVTCR